MVLASGPNRICCGCFEHSLAMDAKRIPGRRHRRRVRFSDDGYRERREVNTSSAKRKAEAGPSRGLNWMRRSEVAEFSQAAD